MDWRNTLRNAYAPHVLVPYVPPPASRRSNVADPEPSILSKNIFEAMHSETASSYADVTLISSDGQRIPAVRMLLAISSLYFKKLLNSEFAEKNLSEISVGIASSPVRQIVDFIYTDDCRPIRLVRQNEYPSEGPLCNAVRELIDLGCAADYTQMERLLSRCESALVSLMMQHPHVSSVVLQAMNRQGSEWGKTMFREAKRNVLIHVPKSLLLEYDRCDLKCGVMHLDERTAEDVFAVSTERCLGGPQHHEMFQALVLWASGGAALRERMKRPLSGNSMIMIDVGKMKILDERVATAKRISTQFKLNAFTPKFLADVVEPSSLFEPAAVNAAYKQLSLQYQETALHQSQQPGPNEEQRWAWRGGDSRPYSAYPGSTRESQGGLLGRNRSDTLAARRFGPWAFHGTHY